MEFVNLALQNVLPVLTPPSLTVQDANIPTTSSNSQALAWIIVRDHSIRILLIHLHLNVHLVIPSVCYVLRALPLIVKLVLEETIIMELILVLLAILSVLHVRILDLLPANHVIFLISWIVLLVHLIALDLNGKIKETRVTQFALLAMKLANSATLQPQPTVQNATLVTIHQNPTLLAPFATRHALLAQET